MTFARRSTLIVAVLAVALLGVLAAACGGEEATPTATAAPVAQATPTVEEGPVEIVFFFGSFEPTIARANLDIYEQQSGNSVDYHAEPWATLPQKMTTILSTKVRPVDLLYVGDEQLGSYAEAGWVVPIDDYPGIGEYKKDLDPYVLEAMTYDGKLYGLPYYADFNIFVYNEDLLKAAGYDEFPTTWDGVRQLALTMKEKQIMEYPWVSAYRKDYVGTFAEFISMVFSDGGHFFDDQMNPLYPDQDPAALNVLEWLVKAVNEWKIIDVKSIEMNGNDVRDAIGAGQAAFGTVGKYHLQILNDPEKSQIVGKAKMAAYPKFDEDDPGGSMGFVRMQSVAAQSKHKDAAWDLLKFVGGRDKNGEFRTAKNWFTTKGLGFGYPELLDDPDVVASMKKWGDPQLIKQEGAKARPRENLKTPWFQEWETHLKALLQDAILQKITAREALQGSADKARELKADWSD